MRNNENSNGCRCSAMERIATIQAAYVGFDPLGDN